MAELFIRQSIEIQAPAEKVWEVLTHPAMTRQYMFGCDVVSDWKIGSPVLWKGVLKGKELVYVKGQVVTYEPYRLLQYTTFGSEGKLADVPSNYVTVTHKLTPREGGILLEVSQGDFAGIEDSEKRYKDGLAGWSMIIPSIKDLAEKP